MSKTSVIRHPTGAYFIRRFQWQVDMLLEWSGAKRQTDTINAGAEIISVMEFHLNNPTGNDMLRKFVRLARKKTNKKGLLELGIWLPYSTRYLMECVTKSYKKFAVTNGLELLKEVQVIDDNVPKDIPRFYKSANTAWYKLNLEKIQRYSDRISLPVNVTRELPEPKAKPTVSKAVSELTKSIKLICDFDRHIHGFNRNYEYDVVRKGFVKGRLKGGATLVQCCQAILGNRVSKWHQGKHEKNSTKYIGIEYALKNAIKFSQHIRIAEKQDITEEVTKTELQRFIDGLNSRYSKVFEKEKQKEEKLSEKIVTPENEISEEMKIQYVTFAKSVSAYFQSENVDASDVISYCETNNELNKLSKGLVDEPYLKNQILNALKVFIPLDESAEPQRRAVNSFCKRLTMLRKINNG